ncbi:Protein of unknown function (DUF229) [Popillia japonica]|uniref:DUF229 domain containing protein n=1 Tax=Popillia japonica TaxID=7064 RepID=A0AAW1L5V5_POPJA
MKSGTKFQLMDVEESKWRPTPLLYLFIIVSGGVIFFLNVFQMQYTYHVMQPEAIIEQMPSQQFMKSADSDDSMKGFLLKTKGCRIPELKPINHGIKRFIFAEKAVVCNNGTPPLIESNQTCLYIVKSALEAYDVNATSLLACCYQKFSRVDPTDGKKFGKIQYSDCISFNDSVEVDKKAEFVKVTCLYNNTTIYKDFFSFIPPKPIPPLKTIKVTCLYNNTTIYKDFFSFIPPKPIPPLKTSEPKLNVLIIGIDSVSRLNFHRQMPKTSAALKKIKAVELLGYNKVGDNTFPNLMPVLTGLNESQLKETCWPNTSAYFDDCPFIWKKFAQNGYATVFAEDASWMGIFNYQRRGFKHQPTHYFWDTFNREAEKQVGNKHRMNVDQCLGPRETYKVLVNYAEKFAESIQILYNRPYFGFFWSSSLTHDFLNKPKLGDAFFEDFISRLYRKHLLNNTVFIFMSDHGIRWGDIRSTFQGRIEERLPFIHIYIPESYRIDFSLAYSNLARNSRRLTTPYDLHKTLEDLLNPYALNRDFLRQRQENQTERREYSLFDAISPERTCEDASISQHWCTCQSAVKIATNESVIVEAANFTVDFINRLLVGYADCVLLKLDEVIDSSLQIHQKDIEDKRSKKDYTLILRTKPGSALFEATVRRETKADESYSYEIIGTISRINLYGRQITVALLELINRVR